MSSPPPRRAARLHPQLGLVLAAALFGFSFVIVKDSIEDLTPPAFIAMRFALGAAVLAPFAIAAERRAVGRGAAPLDRRLLVRAGLLLGVALASGFLLQTIGLVHTTASTSAFITGLYVVLIPLFERVLGRRRLATHTLAAVGLAVFGLFVLSGAQLGLGFGDAVTLACAAAFAVHFIVLGDWAPRFRPMTLNTAQVAVVAVVAMPMVLVDGVGALTGRALVGVAVTAIGCTAAALALQVHGQQRVVPTRAGLLLLLEPVFAGIIGYVVGDRLGFGGAVGAVLILAAVLVEETGAGWLTRRREARRRIAVAVAEAA